MAPKRKPEEPPAGAPAWMCTMSDLMNLLLCFFVMLFAMSSVDQAKYEEFIAAMSNSFSIFDAGATAIGDGVLISNGVSQLNELDEYINSTGKTAESEIEADEFEDYENKMEELQEALAAADLEGLEEALAALDLEKLKEALAAADLEALKEALAEVNLEGLEEALAALDLEKLKEALAALDMEELKAALAAANLEGLKEALAEASLQNNEQLAEKIGEAVDEGGMTGQIEISFNEQYVQLSMRGALLFDSGRAELREESTKVLDKVGVILERYSDGLIEIEGHTDNVPINSSKFASNEELSDARALSVFYYLQDSTSLDPVAMKHSGMGERVPIADNSTEEGRSKNRRVEIRIHNPS